MPDTLRTIGIITARGGSKGIPRKNIVPLAGRPLVEYMIEAANNAKLLTRCVVTTDDEEIAEICKKAGGDVPFMRPVELAQDDTRDLPVLQHAVNWLKDNDNEEYDAVMMLHPTAPLILGTDIDDCIEKMVETDADSVMSMMQVTDFAPQKMKTIDESGQIHGLFEEEGADPLPRRECPPVYRRNAAIYLTKTELIMNNDLFGNRSMAVVMPEERSVDVNTPIDLDLCEVLLKKRNGT